MILIWSSSLAESRQTAARLGLHRNAWRHLWTEIQLKYNPSRVLLCECVKPDKFTLPMLAKLISMDIDVERIPCKTQQS